MKQKNGISNQNKWQAVVIIVCCVVAAAGILFLKTASDRHSPLHQQMELAQSLGVSPDSTIVLAIPDTTIDAGVLPSVPDTLPAALPDSIGRDLRPARSAGVEDGLLAGANDAYVDEYKATYDESSAFPSKSEKHAYAEGYREGYEKGFVEARLHENEVLEPKETGDKEEEIPTEPNEEEAKQER